MGMLTGSDYTLGVEGVGPVTALEILAEFEGTEYTHTHTACALSMRANIRVGNRVSDPDPDPHVFALPGSGSA